MKKFVIFLSVVLLGFSVTTVYAAPKCSAEAKAYFAATDDFEAAYLKAGKKIDETVTAAQKEMERTRKIYYACWHTDDGMAYNGGVLTDRDARTRDSNERVRALGSQWEN